MIIRVKKVVRSEEEVLYFPQFLNWFWWDYFASKECCWEPARFKTEQEAWNFIKFVRNYPKISYSYKEKNNEHV